MIIDDLRNADYSDIGSAKAPVRYLLHVPNVHCPDFQFRVSTTRVRKPA